MNKRIFLSFAALATLLAVLVPLWAFNKDGSTEASPAKVAASDQDAKNLFQTNCGSCHALDRAATDGVVGPDLDERLAGVAGPAIDDTGVQANQSRVVNAIANGFGGGAMPAGILQGADAENVANFVARVAGR